MKNIIYPTTQYRYFQIDGNLSFDVTHEVLNGLELPISDRFCEVVCR